ncbi:glycine--tRNA ligase subunit beta [Chromatium okenii]|uniref:glycine--tRNA ligase subunit beta n=1 Tax=Chromatium okenii TaxID=61644 RepID=UPI00241350A1|nr:glycine--tRNA ligase subunit beta [Chromatium okenii]
MSKCDLVTAMVYEFPSLQGVMGRYYAERSGEAPEVCAALAEQYQPKFAAMRCRRAIAARCWRSPSGLTRCRHFRDRATSDRHPRSVCAAPASIAVLRLLIENGIDLDLREVLRTAALVLTQAFSLPTRWNGAGVCVGAA